MPEVKRRVVTRQGDKINDSPAPKEIIDNELASHILYLASVPFSWVIRRISQLKLAADRNP